MKLTTLSSLKPNDLVLIEWLDAHADLSETGRAGSIETRVLEKATVLTPGWFIGNRNDWVAIAWDLCPLVAESEDNLQNVFRVPRGWVKRVWLVWRGRQGSSTGKGP